MMRRTRRRGFTLLELLLATLIASLLLAALYFMMTITLRQTQDARDAVEIDAVSRGAFARMTLDLSSVLGPMPPKSGGNSDSTGATSTTDSSTTSTSSTTTDATTIEADVPFQGGLVGTDKQFTVFISRVPEPLTSSSAMQMVTDPSSGIIPHDLRRISYWLGENGGLCRQVRPWVTAEEIGNSTDPDRSSEAGDTILEEVTDLTFEYFDGTTWATTWDGSGLGPDGVTPMGPPRAIRATLVLAFKSSPNAVPLQRTVSHVIAIRTAPGLLTLAFIDPASTDTGTTDPTTGSGSSGTGGTTTGGSTAGGSGTTPTPAATGGGAATSGGGRTGGSAATGGGAAAGGRTGGGAATSGGGRTGGGGR